MTTAQYLWTPPPVQSLPVRGRRERLPINRIFCVGRNYHAHAVEMAEHVKVLVASIMQLRPFDWTPTARPC